MDKFKLPPTLLFPTIGQDRLGFQHTGERVRGLHSTRHSEP